MRRIWNFAGTAVWSSRQGRTEPLFYKWLLFECGNQPVPCSDNVCGSPPPFERIYQGIRSGLTIQYSYCAVIWVVIFVMKTPLVGLVFSETTSATATGAVEYLTVMSALFFYSWLADDYEKYTAGLGLQYAGNYFWEDQKAAVYLE